MSHPLKHDLWLLRCESMIGVVHLIHSYKNGCMWSGYVRLWSYYINFMYTSLEVPDRVTSSSDSDVDGTPEEPSGRSDMHNFTCFIPTSPAVLLVLRRPW